jgi:hypothetical protein
MVYFNFLFVVDSLTAANVAFLVDSLAVADRLFVIEDRGEKRRKVTEGR